MKRASGKGGHRSTLHQSKLVEEGGPVMLNPMKTAELDSLPLSGFGLQPPETSRRKSELLNITDKISKALQDFDNLYDDNPDENLSMMEDVSRQINDLDSGPLKMQMKSFMGNYKDMTARMETANGEREEILESLADWFTEDHLGTDNMLSFDINQEEHEDDARKEFLDTKLGFEKLQRLKQEIAEMKMRGSDISDLTRQKQKLQQKVISSFKRHNAEKKKVAESQAQPLTDDMGGAWKGAANEICGLLQKVRDQGTDYITELEKKVKEMANDLEKEASRVLKLQASLVESKQMENRWKEDNAKLTSAVARADGRVRKLKKQLRNTQKRLSNYEAVVVIPKEDGEDEIEDDVVPRKKSDHGTVASGSPEVTILKTQLKDCRNQLDKMTKDHEELQIANEGMKSALEEKDEQIEGLLHDNSELMQQMKKASLKPDTRHLSSSFHNGHPEARGRKGSVPSAIFGGTVNGSPLAASASNTSSKHSKTSDVCKKCKGIITQDSSPSVSDVVRSPCSARSVLLASTHSVTTTENMKTNRDKQLEIDELSQRCEEYENSIGSLHEQLAKAHQDIASIRRGRTGTMAPCSTPQVNENIAEIEHEVTGNQGIDVKRRKGQKKTVNRLVIGEDEQLGVTPISEDPLMATLKAGKGVNPHKMEHKAIQAHHLNAIGSAEEIYEKTVTTTANGEKLILAFATRGMQTDPKLDPLGAWSMGVHIDKPGWKPPMPPSSWVDYDPTFNSRQGGQPSDSQKATKRVPPGVAEAMLKGEDPAAVRSEAINVANFLEREMNRMVQGVDGYIQYMNTLIEEEAKWMEEANTQLKSHLTQAEQDRLHKNLRRPLTSNLFGRQSNLHSVITDNITAGRTGVSHIEDGKPLHKNNLTDFEKSERIWNSSEDRMKDSLHSMADETVETFKKAYRVIIDTLQGQHKQYEHIFNIIQKREGDNSMPKIFASYAEDNEEKELLLKRSVSDSCLAVLSGGQETSNNPLLRVSKMNISSTSVGTHTSRSNTVLTEDQRTQVFNQTFGQSSTLDSTGLQNTSMTQDAKKIGMATIPKTGMIQLTTGRTVRQRDALEDFVVERPKAKHRPAPLNHQKLMQKMNMMKSSNKKKTDAGNHANVPVHGQKYKKGGLLSEANYPLLLQLAEGSDPLDTLQLNDRLLGGYTIGELEQRAEQVFEKSTKEHKGSLTADIFGDLQNILPPVSPRTASEQKKNVHSSDGDATKLPPIKP